MRYPPIDPREAFRIVHEYASAQRAVELAEKPESAAPDLDEALEVMEAKVKEMFKPTVPIQQLG